MRNVENIVAASSLILVCLLSSKSFANIDTCVCLKSNHLGVDSQKELMRKYAPHSSSGNTNTQIISICSPSNITPAQLPPEHVDPKSDDKNFIERNPALLTAAATLFTAAATLFGIYLTISFASRREKARVIRKARIQWAQSLRELVSEFTVLSEQVFIEMRLEFVKEVENIVDGQKVPETEKEKILRIQKILSSKIEKLGKAEGLANNILLHLNPDQNKHRELKRIISRIRGSLSYNSLIANQFDTDAIEESIEEAAIVIKEAWEQAKE